MNTKDFERLLDKYQNKELTSSEEKLLDEWMDTLAESGNSPTWTSIEVHKLYAQIKPKQTLSLVKIWLSSAAAILILLLGFYLLRDNRFEQSKDIVMTNILPADDKAKLVLENGKEIYLDEDKEGLTIIDGDVFYTDGSSLLHEESQILQLSIVVPKGRKYQLTLSDGTKVWINASSTLRYPSKFDKNERIVALDGEAYFEVAAQYDQQTNTKIPFRVQSADQIVDVLGTHFNISTYSNDNYIETTLFEGIVDVSNQFGKTVRLKPSQQSKVIQGKSNIAVVGADLESVSSWRNDLFVFNNSSLKEVLNEVERWYDVKVNIKEWPKDRFYGEINRNVPLSEVINMIEKSSNLKFKLISEGNERRLFMQ